jgi:hypothetical protein
VVVSPRCPIAATDGALAVVDVVRQSWDYDGDCAAVAAGTDGSGFVSHVVRVCFALGFERERAEFRQCGITCSLARRTCRRWVHLISLSFDGQPLNWARLCS